MKFHHLLLFASSLVLSSVHADTLIDSASGNGGFVNEATGNVTPDGWTATSGVYVAAVGSTLETAPFGSDLATNSRFVQIHKDGGETFTSNVTFTVAPGNSINLSLDYKIGGSGTSPVLQVSLWDSATNTTFATLGTIDTATPQAAFIQRDFPTYVATAASSKLRLRFTLPAAGGLGKDIHIDRVHLSGGVITPPEPPIPIAYAYEHFIDPSDSAAIKVEKAAKTLPKQKQVDWQRLENTFFIHFGPNTFSGNEWGTGFEDPANFNPTALDAAQWVTTIKNAGGKMLMLVVKHHEGFCLYPSRYTTHDVASSPWLGGNGDLVRMVSDACAAQGLKFGVYLSPADLFQIWGKKENQNDTRPPRVDYTEGVGYYGNQNASNTVQTSIIPTDPATFNSNPAQGRTPAAGFGTYSYAVDDYNRFFLNQLYELLTQYGDIAEMWFDGANPDSSTNQSYNRADWYNLIYTLQPNINIAIDGPDIRWVGNENGIARETEWSVIPNPMNNGQATDLGSRAMLAGGKTLRWRPAEADTKILNGWFWKASHGVKSANQILDIYYKSVGRNSNLLLNLSPDTRGLIPEKQITPLMEAMTVIKQTFATNLAAGGTMTADSTLAGQDAANIIDGDLDTYWEPQAGVSTPTLTLTLPSPQTFDRIVLQEAIAVRSMRIETFAVDTWNGTGWDQKATSTVVGHKRILMIPTTITDKVRIRITQARLEPTLANVGLYKSVTLLPSPVIASRNAAGKVAITAGVGDSIYYTMDGSDPTTASTLYTAPFGLPLGGTVKAIARNGGAESFATVMIFSGYSPSGWQVIAFDSQEAGVEPATSAIDDNPATIWHTKWTGSGPNPHYITIDMLTPRWISGFSYLPRASGENGIVKTYRFETSEDNVTWTNVAESEFGNMKNSPVLQQVFFANSVKARYFRFTSLSEINGAVFASAAEINVLPGGFDSWKLRKGLQNESSATDSDGDGRSNWQEYAQGSNPFVSDQANPVIAWTGSGDAPSLSFKRPTDMPDVSCTLQAVETLGDEWQDVAANVEIVGPADDGTQTVRYTEANPPVGAARRFYRLSYKTAL